MKTCVFVAGLLAGSVLSLLFLQTAYSQALPMAANRPERGPASGPPIPSGTLAAAAASSIDSGDLSPYVLGTIPPEPTPPGPSSAPSPLVAGGPAVGMERSPTHGEQPAATTAGPSPNAASAGAARETKADSSPVFSSSAKAVAQSIRRTLRAATDAVKKVASATRTKVVSAEVSAPLPPKQGLAGPEILSINPPMNRLIRQYMDIYQSPSGLDWLRIVLRRSAPYLSYIASRIQHYHLPPELIWLPVVESTYNTYAVSYAGAAGLWQLMPSSAYPAGLQMNEWMDQRFDFWLSTNVSLEKLKYNYEVLGSWLLALAAYNAGLNYVTEVVRRTGIRNVWELGEKGYLPYETMVYIPKFLAIARICSFPGRYGLPVTWDARLQWTRIPLHQAVDLRILARDAGISEWLLLEGNAELRYDITPPGNSGYYLNVPKNDVAAVERVLRNQQHHLMRFYIYTVRPGDTLYDLSLYYGVPISMMLQYNPGVSARYLQIGQRLVIPGIRDVPPYRASYSSRYIPSGPKITLHDPTGRFTGLYTVRPGDTLWAIAKIYGISTAELAKVNGISESTIIHAGNVLHVPGPGALITQGGY